MINVTKLVELRMVICIMDSKNAIMPMEDTFGLIIQIPFKMDVTLDVVSKEDFLVCKEMNYNSTIVQKFVGMV